MLFVCSTAADMLRYRTKDILIIMFGKTVRIFVLNLNFDDFDLAEIHNKQSADSLPNIPDSSLSPCQNKMMGATWTREAAPLLELETNLHEV